MGTVDSFARLPTLLMLTVIGLGGPEGATASDWSSLIAPDGRPPRTVAVLLIALVAALLTTVPFFPVASGLSEAGMIGVLTHCRGVTNSAAVSIRCFDAASATAAWWWSVFVIFVLTPLHASKAHRARLRGERRSSPGGAGFIGSPSSPMH